MTARTTYVAAAFYDTFRRWARANGHTSTPDGWRRGDGDLAVHVLYPFQLPTAPREVLFLDTEHPRMKAVAEAARLLGMTIRHAPRAA